MGPYCCGAVRIGPLSIAAKSLAGAIRGISVTTPGVRDLVDSIRPIKSAQSQNCNGCGFLKAKPKSFVSFSDCRSLALAVEGRTKVTPFALQGKKPFQNGEVHNERTEPPFVFLFSKQEATSCRHEACNNTRMRAGGNQTLNF